MRQPKSRDCSSGKQDWKMPRLRWQGRIGRGPTWAGSQDPRFLGSPYSLETVPPRPSHADTDTLGETQQ